MRFRKIIVNGKKTPNELLIYDTDNSESSYSKMDFIRLCKGDDAAAFNLYSLCDGQCPETILEEDSLMDIEEQSFPFCHSFEKNYSKRQMESAIEIAHIAGKMGYHTENSRYAMQQFEDWAVDFEKTDYSDDEWMELIETYGVEKMLSCARENQAVFGEEFEKQSLLAAQVIAYKTHKKILECSSGVLEGSVLGVTGLHVVQNLGKAVKIFSLIDLDATPKVGENIRINLNNSHGKVISLAADKVSEVDV